MCIFAEVAQHDQMSKTFPLRLSIMQAIKKLEVAKAWKQSYVGSKGMNHQTISYLPSPLSRLGGCLHSKIQGDNSTKLGRGESKVS